MINASLKTPTLGLGAHPGLRVLFAMSKSIQTAAWVSFKYCLQKGVSGVSVEYNIYLGRHLVRQL